MAFYATLSGSQNEKCSPITAQSGVKTLPEFIKDPTTGMEFTQYNISDFDVVNLKSLKALTIAMSPFDKNVTIYKISFESHVYRYPIKGLITDYSSLNFNRFGFWQSDDGTTANYTKDASGGVVLQFNANSYIYSGLFTPGTCGSLNPNDTLKFVGSGFKSQSVVPIVTLETYSLDHCPESGGSSNWDTAAITTWTTEEGTGRDVGWIQLGEFKNTNFRRIRGVGMGVGVNDIGKKMILYSISVVSPEDVPTGNDT
jgi:hypothetical protein